MTKTCRHCGARDHDDGEGHPCCGGHVDDEWMAALAAEALPDRPDEDEHTERLAAEYGEAGEIIYPY